MDFEIERHNVGEGWWDLLDRLHADLVVTDPDHKVIQIKEKFGGLRYYTDDLSREGQELVTKAETASYTICERCGKPGIPRPGGWTKTLCDNHWPWR